MPAGGHIKSWLKGAKIVEFKSERLLDPLWIMARGFRDDGLNGSLPDAQ